MQNSRRLKAESTEASQLIASRYNLFSRLPDGSLIVANSWSGGCVAIAAGDADTALAMLNPDSGKTFDIQTDGVQEFFDAGLVVPEYADEYRRLRYHYTNVTSRADEQHLILFPTEQCNFRCVYCYEDFVKGEMSEDVVAGIANYLRRRIPFIKRLKLDWFGGEPLMGMNVIRTIMTEAQRNTARHSCELHSHITTNGYLGSSGSQGTPT